MPVAARSQVEVFEKRQSCCSAVAQSVILWKFRELPRLKVSQDLRESVTKAVEQMFRRCMDQIPDPQGGKEGRGGREGVPSTQQGTPLQQSAKALPWRLQLS